MNKKQNKIIIIVLAVLLGLSLAGLATTYIYNQIKLNEKVTVEIDDNLITPDKEDDQEEVIDTSNQTSNNDEESKVNTSTNTSNEGQTVSNTNTKKAILMNFYRHNDDDNEPFKVTNMFPGDIETKYYGINVTYHDEVEVHFKADVRDGYEKLAEVLKFKVTLLTNNEVLYDGLMKDMDESVVHKLSSKESTNEELYYELSAYLDTSVGNEYQNLDLIADFKWWIEGKENLDENIKTGDSSNIQAWVAIAAISGILCLILLIKNKKEEDAYHG